MTIRGNAELKSMGAAAGTMEIEERNQVASYSKYPFSVTMGRDVWVITEEGRRYLDLYGGHAVASTGHCHPDVVRAVSEQASRLIFYSNLVYNDARARASEKLVGIIPPPLARVFFVNSGAEANENAIRIARKVTGRRKVISFEGSFHGRTPGSLAATGIMKYRAGAEPLLPGHTLVPFGDAAAVGQKLDCDTAAVLLEPIQSMGGVRMAGPGFYASLRERCDRAGALLIYDEVQTGMGRTGEYFFAGRYGVAPDVVTLAKGIASGLPMGAVLVTEAIAAKIKGGDLGSTFGGGPLAAAALEATVDIIRREGLLANVRENSQYLFAKLRELPCVLEARGLGYLVGIRFRDGDAPRRQKALLERGIITGLADDRSVLRLLPPLTLKKPEIDIFLAELQDIDRMG